MPDPRSPEIVAAAPRGRRHFLQTAVALGLSISGLPARADAAPHVVFGFVITPSIEAVLIAVLRQLQTRYRPDLGTRPLYLPGNSGTTAMEVVAKAPPDGGTVFMSSSASMTLLPGLRKMPVDPVDLLQPVAGVAKISFAFVVGPAVPADVKSMADYLAWAGANPILATYGVPGRGTASHFIGTEIARLGKTRLKSIAYKGTLPLLDDLASGSLPACATLMLNAADMARYPSLRVLAVSTNQRWKGSEAIPTLNELGLAESPTVSSLGCFISARTPPDMILALRDAIGLTLIEPSVVSAIDAAGFQAMPAGIDYRAQIAGERAEWVTRIARLDFSADS